MPAWNEARRAGKVSRNKVMADRASGSDTKSALPQASERWRKQVCIYCGKKAGAKVGHLAITGNVVFCKGHKEQYYNDKAWEERRKMELGL